MDINTLRQKVVKWAIKTNLDPDRIWELTSLFCTQDHGTDRNGIEIRCCKSNCDSARDFSVAHQSWYKNRPGV